MRAGKATTTSDKAATHDTTMPLLDSMYSEFKELSKKKPDAAVSKSKINIANRLLARVRGCEKTKILILNKEFW